MIVIRLQVAVRQEGRTSPLLISWASWAAGMSLENITQRTFDLPDTWAPRSGTSGEKVELGVIRVCSQTGCVQVQVLPLPS